MRSVLIAGCGYVGMAAAKLFATAGWKVTGWTFRSHRQVTDVDISFDLVDIADPERVSLKSYQPDIVVHCAGVPHRDPESYARVYRGGVSNLAAYFPGARLIFTSSTSVYAQTDGSWVDEESLAEPENENGQILRESEEIVLAQGGFVLRLGGIYGPGRSFLLQSVLNGITTALPDRFVNQIHRDDAAAAILFVAGSEKIPPATVFNVVDGSPVLRSEIVKWLSEQLSVSPTASQPGKERLARAKSNKRVSNARLRQLGWMPTYLNYRKAFGKSIFPSFNLTQDLAHSRKT